MAVGKFLTKDEEGKLVQLIKTIESRTTGELCLHIAKKVSRKGILSDAADRFRKLGIDQTEHKNGVLLYIALNSHELSCIGDQGIHQKVGDTFWRSIVDQLQVSFAKADFFTGLTAALEAIGETLRKHFPAEQGASNPNELPDEISKS